LSAKSASQKVEEMRADDHDLELVRAWLTARSAARGLPAPIPDRGGWRVDTGSKDEICRWVFADAKEGLVELGRALREPGYLIKLCGAREALRAALPDRWKLLPPAYFMSAATPLAPRALPDGYALHLTCGGGVAEARVSSIAQGTIVAGGFATEAAGVFIFDRIHTSAEHRRKGLGAAIVTALVETKFSAAATVVLVATEDGRALYSRLGAWSVSPYSTAAVPPA
jgi:GNAT superfamily N-acetyltransferase